MFDKDSFKKMFNKLMLPNKITALPTRLFGEDLCKQFDGVKVKWADADYDISIYASKTDNDSYDLFLDISTDTLDKRSYILDHELSLHAALKAVRIYDDKRTKELNDKHIPIKRSYQNIQRVRERLFKNGILKH